MPLFFFISGFVLYKPDVEWNGIMSFKFIAKKSFTTACTYVGFHFTIYLCV